MSDQDLQNATDEEMDAFLSRLFGPGKEDDDEADSAADGGQVDAQLSAR